MDSSSIYVVGRGASYIDGFLYANTFFLKVDLAGNQSIISHVIGDHANTWRKESTGDLFFINDTTLVTSGYFANYDTLFLPPFYTEHNGVSYIFNTDGDTLFTRKFIGDGYTEFTRMVYDVTNSQFILGGATLDTLISGIRSYLVGTDVSGNILWEQKEGDGIKNEIGGLVDLFDNGNIVSGGIIDNGPPDFIRTGKFYKYTPSGTAYFSKEIGTEGDDSEIEVKVAKNQKSLIVRQYIDTVINEGDYPYPSYVGKMDTSGNFIWRTFLNDAYYKYFYTLRTFNDGSIVVVGAKIIDETFATYGYIIKLDSNGTILWERTYAVTDGYDHYLYDFQQLPDKGYIGSGVGVTEIEDEGLESMCWLLRLDSMGCLVPGCGDVPIIDFVPETKVNILSIYPNPVAETAVAQIAIPQNFIIEPNQNLTLTIFDINGKVVDVYSNITVNNLGEVIRFYLHIKTLAKGIYPSVLTYGNAFLDEVKIIVQ